MNSYKERKKQLKEHIYSLLAEDVVVAFSGGVDSSLLLKLCCDAAQKTGNRVYAFMLHTMLHPAAEVEEAREMAKDVGAQFQVLNIDELANAGIEENPQERCYLCKKYLFQTIINEAKKQGIHTVLEGTNEDDLHLYRPGIRAIKELGVISPLAKAGFSKQEVRMLAKELGVSTSDKASTPCLATRFPYGIKLSHEEMRKVEQGEEKLKSLGLYNVRLRVHGDIARIEVDETHMITVMEHRIELIAALKKLGYTYITMDIEGFRSGSMDDKIDKKQQ